MPPGQVQKQLLNVRVFVKKKRVLLEMSGAKTDRAHASATVSQARARDTRYNRAEDRYTSLYHVQRCLRGGGTSHEYTTNHFTLLVANSIFTLGILRTQAQNESHF